MKSKKGALSLSVSAIVILVIAFVVLGLALTLTRYVFKLGMEKTGEAIDIVELEMQPTPDNTITIEKIIIARTETKELKIGVYNKLPEKITGATLSISECQDSSGDPVADIKIPSISTISQDIPASESAGYKAIFTEQGLEAGNYICKLQLLDSIDAEKDSKQFFLTVTA